MRLSVHREGEQLNHRREDFLIMNTNEFAIKPAMDAS